MEKMTSEQHELVHTIATKITILNSIYNNNNKDLGLHYFDETLA